MLLRSSQTKNSLQSKRKLQFKSSKSLSKHKISRQDKSKRKLQFKSKTYKLLCKKSVLPEQLTLKAKEIRKDLKNFRVFFRKNYSQEIGKSYDRTKPVDLACFEQVQRAVDTEKYDVVKHDRCKMMIFRDKDGKTTHVDMLDSRPLDLVLKQLETEPNNPRLLWFACLAYCYGIPERNKALAFEYALKAEKFGSVKMQTIYLIGKCYEQGLGTDVDDSKALEYFEKCYAMGHSLSRIEIALLLVRRDNISANHHDRIFVQLKRFEEASEMGCERASHILGQYYAQKGDDYIDIAVNYYKRALSLGWSIRLFDPVMGLSIKINKIGEKHEKEGNYKDSLKYFQMGYELGQNKETSNIANIYLHMQEVEKAIEWLELGIEKGVIENYIGLANIYDRRKDYVRLMKYLKLAFENGIKQNGDIAAKIGSLILEGKDGGWADKSEAIKWFKIASDSGSKIAPGYLGQVYTSRSHTDPPDLVEGLKWFLLALERGMDVNFNVAQIYFVLDDYEKTIEHAKLILEDDETDYDSEALLGIAYWQLGFREKGRKHLINAKEQNSEFAEKYISKLGETFESKAEYHYLAIVSIFLIVLLIFLKMTSVENN